MRDFLWDGFDGEKSSHLVSWEVVSKPKEAGGLGIENLILRNKVLLGKWWWRCHKERQSLWGKDIESKYGMQENGWDAGLALRTAFRCHGSLFPEFIRFSKAKAKSLKNRFPNLYRISKLKNKPISSFLAEPDNSLNHSVIYWDLQLIRNLKDNKILEFCWILDILSNLRLRRLAG